LENIPGINSTLSEKEVEKINVQVGENIEIDMGMNEIYL